MTLRTTCCLAVVLVTVDARAQLVTNGSFETPVIEATWQTFPARHVFGAWTVGSGDLDIFRSAQEPYDGEQSLDLNGFQPGSVWQDIATLPGEDYALDLAFAGQPGGRNQNPVKTFRIDFGGFTWTQSFDTTGHRLDDLGWQPLSLTIPGADLSHTTTRFTLTSVGAGSSTRGPTIDAIQLRPESAPSDPSSLADGSFETPVLVPRWQTFSAGQVIGGWTVGSGDVDVFVSAQEPYDGQQSLDLNGERPGSIWQDVATIPGQEYLLQLAFAGQPGGSNQNPIKAFRIDFGGFTWTQSVDTTGRSLSDLGWQPLSLRIPGSDIREPMTRLMLTSVGTGSTSRGPTIDAVSLKAVPEPASVLLCVWAAISASYLHARRRRHPARLPRG